MEETRPATARYPVILAISLAAPHFLTSSAAAGFFIVRRRIRKPAHAEPAP